MMQEANGNLERRFAAVSRSKTLAHIIAELELDKKSVFDIGCSFGEFLTHFGEGSVGLTIAENEAAHGKMKGLDIRLGNIESDDFKLDEQFDAIFANNIFEHLYSPHEFLCRIKRYLKPGGVLVLGVPCIPRIASLIHFKKFRGSLATQHINFFTRETLYHTVLRGGWNISDMRGFHFACRVVDKLLDLVYPHFYVIAHVDPDFVYSDKRLKELAGYNNIP
ncbi:MAG: hypothetical protein A2845_03330 [Candidatus Lloydbacteria bacterium RIFCSPHIGHO2_01_FULL_49_22]|uniref:Methyltransferase type 11 domain-containing protein n=1 Tax=Candidatus Lloydbacteria bacterium RIFCSPHIGHO2_01_FULL_49_22 TaxID=1798658 RepID=A0A1G2CYQ4_9BACT|nr:MAG: hypothetical protein A2845_03330 [Candidatus Lloydbacteria bacterium RIFCSPHIGHO2_01_FULL_49_22]